MKEKERKPQKRKKIKSLNRPASSTWFWWKNSLSETTLIPNQMHKTKDLGNK